MDVACDRLMVCAPWRWVVDDMQVGSAGRWPVERVDHRVVPAVPPGRTAWWVTTGDAARLVASGVDLPLAFAGPGWLSRVDVDLTGRRVATGRLAAAAASPAASRPGFVKPAQAKVDQLPGRWVEDVAVALQAAMGAGAHPDMWVQWTDTRLDLAWEFRTYVLAGRPVAVSVYATPDGVAWEPGLTGRPDAPVDAAFGFAGDVAATAARDLPAAAVVDVAVDTSGRWLVVEANAPWAANPYDCDLGPVVDCVVASSTGDPGRFTWRPDPHEAAWAATNPMSRDAGSR